MTFQFRILKSLLDEIVSDLRRPHEFAYERVGFLSCRIGQTDECTLLLPFGYEPVLDTDYLPDDSVGARIGVKAIRCAMQYALDNDVTVLHVHLHDQRGRPAMSRVDKVESQKLVPSFFNVRPNKPHGALILSRDSAGLWMWTGKDRPAIRVDDISIIGSPIRIIRSAAPLQKNPTLVRQSFLGKDAELMFQTVRVGIVGLGGGGSHIVQQLAHLGIKHFLLFDPDKPELSNLNRLVGATLADVRSGTKKVVIADRYIRGVNPNALVELFDTAWQRAGTAIRSCDIIFGCMDTFQARQELEASARRYFIPYIDIGMDVAEVANEYFMSGQVILSIPGQRCMKCMGFLTDDKLGKEAALYGAAGEHPQVVWANGVLASSAVGKFVHLVTGWTSAEVCLYDTYDGNAGTVSEHPRLRYNEQQCSHYPLTLAGDPFFE